MNVSLFVYMLFLYKTNRVLLTIGYTRLLLFRERSTYDKVNDRGANVNRIDVTGASIKPIEVFFLLTLVLF